jgi:type I restriction enzyme S subunit
MNWDEVTLDSICTVISSGGTPSRKHPEYFAEDGTGHPWVKSKELLDKRITDTEERITDAGLKESSAKYYPANTVLVAMYGANVGQLGWLAQPATVNQAICGLVVDPAKADWRFVFYSLLHHRGDLVVQAQGAAQQNLNQDLIRSFAIPCPPSGVQTAIAGILAAYDDLIENNLRRIQIHEEMARAIYREWFVRLRFPRHTAEDEAESRAHLPAGWSSCAFTDVADVLSGGTPRTGVDAYWGGEIPFFTPRDAPDSCFVFSTEKSITKAGLESCASELYPAGTLFITARGTVGKLALAGVPMAMNQSCYALRGRDGIPQGFLYQLVADRVAYLKTNTGGATFDTIVIDTFRRMVVIRPPQHLVDSYSAATGAMYDQIADLLQQVANLRATRDLLLPRLMSGRLTLPEAEEAAAANL